MSGRPDPTTVASYVTLYSGYPPAARSEIPLNRCGLHLICLVSFLTDAASVNSLQWLLFC